ncbi:ABC transporter ATP-binding protein [Henriciella barbarensis]|uniref:ABC transporter ATP-binding protein n=1 Tax=Henriciella barbarensis TaxID=86342 RepID=A0A399QTU7_9PROT|nr:ABC transporter ATP-binding protein [Henriciella barbarensis]RIJ22190.1 ABC transporter ATP-binding protein [Henriciella barbarensis]
MSKLQPIHARGVTRRYDGRAVVRNASLTLQPGKITALLGQSGAGKSTLLRLFAGLEPVDSGEILHGDVPVSTISKHVPAEDRQIGLIFQDFALFPHLNAIDNVGFGLVRQNKDKRRETARHWLDRLGLSHRAKAYPHELSGGEQQRVSIARALAAQPVAILMDEPFSGLDVTLKSEVRHTALAAVAEAGIPALLVTHDASEAMRAADRIAVMSEGVILQEETPEKLYLEPVSMAVARALGPLRSVRRDALPKKWQEKVPPAENYCLRPEAVRLDPAGDAMLEVVAAQRTSSLIEIELKLTETETIHALALGPFTPGRGDKLAVSLAPEFVFAAR